MLVFQLAALQLMDGGFSAIPISEPSWDCTRIGSGHRAADRDSCRLLGFGILVGRHSELFGAFRGKDRACTSGEQRVRATAVQLRGTVLPGSFCLHPALGEWAGKVMMRKPLHISLQGLTMMSSMGERRGRQGAAGNERMVNRSSYNQIATGTTGYKDKSGENKKSGSQWTVKQSRSPGTSTSSKNPSSGSVLKNLMAFDSLDSLLAALELYKDSSDGTVSAPQAVAAMNHLKRLGSQARGSREVQSADSCMEVYSRVAIRGMWRLSAKHVALALNAVKEGSVKPSDGSGSVQWKYDELFRVAARRISQLTTVAKRGAGVSEDGRAIFDAQNMANIVNAYAKAPVRQDLRQAVFDDMTVVTMLRGPFDYTAQAVANILNAYARVDLGDKKLFNHLSLAALSMDASQFSPQHISNIVNAYSRAGKTDSHLDLPSTSRCACPLKYNFSLAL